MTPERQARLVKLVSEAPCLGELEGMVSQITDDGEMTGEIRYAALEREIALKSAQSKRRSQSAAGAATFP
jgi:hypothetical protein